MNRPNSSTAAPRLPDNSAAPDNSVAPEHSTDPPAGGRRWLNLGVLAHVDAGKTSLTEALLYAGGAVDRVGRVDDGTTQTDSLALERQRGITIRAAVATFALDHVTVNLVDTPGHPDFIAEVARSLAVLDAAVLVVSAVEGVQAQTIVLFRALSRLGVPTVFFVNKIDRAGADPGRVVDVIRRRLSTAIVPLGTVANQGTPAAVFVPASWHDPATAADVTAWLADHDEALLTDWIRSGRPPRTARLWRCLGRLTRGARTYPVLFGSARTGAGVSELIDTLTDLLPPEPGGDDQTPSGQVFSIERTPGGERVCSVRIRAGRLSVRDRVQFEPGRIGTVAALEVHEPGGAVVRRAATAGQVARVYGFSTARIGDQFGPGTRPDAEPSFPAPALQTAITARDPARTGALHRALVDLADIDPLIRLRPDRREGTLQISVYGQVQQEVIAATLDEDYGIAVTFQAATVVCVERPAGSAGAIRQTGDPDHRFGFTLGVTVQPAPPGIGFDVEVTAVHTSLPLHVYGTVAGFTAAVLGYLEKPFAVGPHGWPVTDVRVIVTASDYPPGGPSAVEVRHTVELVVAEALSRAGTVVCEPVDVFSVEAPEDTLSQVLGLLARHRAVPEAPRTTNGLTIVRGTIPTAEIDAVRARLQTAAHGQAVLESTLHHYSPRASK